MVACCALCLTEAQLSASLIRAKVPVKSHLAEPVIAAVIQDRLQSADAVRFARSLLSSTHLKVMLLLAVFYTMLLNSPRLPAPGRQQITTDRGAAREVLPLLCNHLARQQLFARRHYRFPVHALPLASKQHLPAEPY